MSGLFITFEGTDGAGKSTQIDLLVSNFAKKGMDVLVTREPGGTSIGEKIRELILDCDNTKMCYETEAMLYAAARAQHVFEKILPALKSGKTVICDRFVDSSLVYQGIARNLGIEFIEEINKIALSEIKPDITFFLDLKPEIGIARKKNSKILDRIEQEKIDFHYKVYNGYLKLADLYTDRIKKISGDDSIENISGKIINEVELILANKEK